MSRITAVTMKQLLILTIQCTLHLANLIFVKELVKVCLDVNKVNNGSKIIKQILT